MAKKETRSELSVDQDKSARSGKKEGARARALSRVEYAAEDGQHLQRDHGVAQRLLVLAQLPPRVDVLLAHERQRQRDDSKLAHRAEDRRQLKGRADERLQ